MNYTLQLQTSAILDITEAYKWYEEKQQGLGDRFLVGVRSRIIWNAGVLNLTQWLWKKNGERKEYEIIS